MIRNPDFAAPTSGPSRVSRRWFLILGFWTFIGLLESSKAYVTMELRGLPVGWATVLIGNLPWWYLWALLTPVVFLLGRRFRIVPLQWRGLLAHVTAAVIASGLHLAAAGVLYYYTTTQGTPYAASAVDQVGRFIGGYLATDVVTYFAILTAFEAFEFYRRLREREVQSARLEARNAQLESRLHEVRLGALRAELRPHFLFNTLNTIVGLVRADERDTAVNTLARLGEMLRVSLSGNVGHEVPLREEVAFLRAYLEIEQVRFRDRLTIQVDVSEALGDALVPTHVLQPLVENAIRHGVSRAPGAQRVDVGARAEQGRLSLTVADSGPGFAGPIVEGIGLGNTRARLHQLYGEAARLEIVSVPEQGSRVTVTLPLHRATAAAPGPEVADYV